MLLDADQRDALSEISNVAMGRAGEALSHLLDTFVVLSAPRVRIVDAGERALGLTAPGKTGTADQVTAVRQAFFVDLHGETITVFGMSGDNDVTILLGEGAGEVRNEDEKILDATCIIAGALMSGLTEELGLSVALTAPSILVKEGQLADLNGHLGGWDYALMIDVRLDIQQGPFSCEVFTLMPDQSIQKLREQLDHLLENV
jgi:chemotaxis protein CheC